MSKKNILNGNQNTWVKYSILAASTLALLVSAPAAFAKGSLLDRGIIVHSTAARKASAEMANTQPTSNASSNPKLAQLSKELKVLEQRVNQKTTSIVQSYARSDQQNGLLFEKDYPATTLNVALLKNKNKYGKLTLGGSFEYDAQTYNGNITTVSNGVIKKGSDQYVTGLNLDALANINPWAMAYVSLGIDGGTSFDLSAKQAFVTLGNLNQFPLYVSIGRSYIPFGVFTGNGPWSNNLTKNMLRPSEQNEIIFGYAQNGLELSLTGLNNSVGHQISNFAYDATYLFHKYGMRFHVGASYLNDIRNTGSAAGVYYKTASQRLPAWSINGDVTKGSVTLAAELVSLTRKPSGQTGLPRSWYFSGVYSPVIMGEKTSFAVSFSQSTHLNNVPSPLSAPMNTSINALHGIQRMWIASISRPIWNSIYESIEFAHYTTYNQQKAWALTLDSSVYF